MRILVLYAIHMYSQLALVLISYNTQSHAISFRGWTLHHTNILTPKITHYMVCRFFLKTLQNFKRVKKCVHILTQSCQTPHYLHSGSEGTVRDIYKCTCNVFEVSYWYGQLQTPTPSHTLTLHTHTPPPHTHSTHSHTPPPLTHTLHTLTHSTPSSPTTYSHTPHTHSC